MTRHRKTRQKIEDEKALVMPTYNHFHLECSHPASADDGVAGSDGDYSAAAVTANEIVSTGREMGK